MQVKHMPVAASVFFRLTYIYEFVMSMGELRKKSGGGDVGGFSAPSDNNDAIWEFINWADGHQNKAINN